MCGLSIKSCMVRDTMKKMILGSQWGMKKLILLCLILCFCLPLQVSAKPELTERKITEMLKTLVQAVKKHDEKKIISFFTPKAKFAFEMSPLMGGKQEFNLKEYEKMLKLGWETISTYSYEVKDIKIKLASDKQSAIVTDTTLEVAEIGKQKLISKAREEFSVILYQGKPRIEWLRAKVDIKVSINASQNSDTN